MNNRISERIRYVGVNDYTTQLFEGLWTLPYGVSYNSYLVVDKKIALIDTVEAGFEKEFLTRIKEEIGDRTIDYLIVNHMEPDHSSLVSLMLEIYPGILVIASEKAVPMLEGYYGLTKDDILAVKSGDKISLGESELTFFMTPMVHWIETMVTYSPADKTLFSGDAFGTFRALEHSITDREYDRAQARSVFSIYRDEMIRYYASIVGKYAVPVQSALKQLAGLDIKRICSTHGPIWENGAGSVIDLYDSLSRYKADKGVCIVYGSMYGNTAQAARALAEALSERKIPFVIHNLGVENPSEALRDVFKFNTIAVGSPTYNGTIFPPVEAFMRDVTARLVKDRKFFAFGSYSWAGASVRLLNDIASKAGFELIGKENEPSGLSFSHAYSEKKCDMKAVARLIESRL